MMASAANNGVKKPINMEMMAKYQVGESVGKAMKIEKAGNVAPASSDNMIFGKQQVMTSVAGKIINIIRQSQ